MDVFVIISSLTQGNIAMCDELRWLVDPFSCACTGCSPRSLDICTMTELPMTPQSPINHLKLIHDGHENTRQMV